MTPQDQIIARSRQALEYIADVAAGKRQLPAGTSIIDLIYSTAKTAAAQCAAMEE